MSKYDPSQGEFEMPHADQGEQGVPVKMHKLLAGPVRQRSSVFCARAQFAKFGPSPEVARTFARQFALAFVFASQT